MNKFASLISINHRVLEPDCNSSPAGISSPPHLHCYDCIVIMSTTTIDEATADHSSPNSIDTLNTETNANDRAAATTQSISSFLSLPPEIRTMVYTQYFFLVSANQDGTFHFTYNVRHYSQLACITEAKQVHLICILLALCKQINQEARSLFWSSMTFRSGFPDSRLLQTSAHLFQVLPDLQRHPLVLSLRSIHHIQLELFYNEPSMFIFFKFWDLARFGSNNLELKLFWYGDPSNSRPLKHGPFCTSFNCERSLVINFFHKIRAYQRELEERNGSLELTREEKVKWLTELSS
jgi:hypothetical protein